MTTIKKKIRLKKPDEVPTPVSNTKQPKKKPPIKKKVEEKKPYFIPGYPKEDGPMKYTGEGVLKVTNPEVVITLDRGTFQYVWEMLEARAHTDHQKYGPAVPNIKRVTECAVEAFRNSAEHSFGTPKAPAKKLKLKGKK